MLDIVNKFIITIDSIFFFATGYVKAYLDYLDRCKMYSRNIYLNLLDRYAKCY